jgi:hypothetical protein
MIVPHQLNINKAQLSKIMKGLPIQIKFNDMGSDKGDIVIGLKEGNAKKLYSAYKKGKGCRLCMDNEELDYSMKEGSGFSVNSLVSKAKDLGKKVEKGAVKVGNKIAKPAKQLISKIPAEDRQRYKNEAIGLIGGVGSNLSKMIGEATGDEELGGMVENAVVGIGDELLSGKKLKVGSKVMPIAKRAVNNAVDMIEDDKARMVAKSIVKKAGMGLYGKAGEGLRGSGLTGNGLSGGMLDRSRPTTYDMRKRQPTEYMTFSGEGFNLGKAIGSEFKKGARATKTALFGKRMGDEMGYILPVAGATLGAAVGGLSGPIGATFGSSAGAMGGKALAEDMKKRGYGVKRKVGRPAIKPASDIPTYSPYQQLSSPAFSPFYPKTSFQNGGNGENRR